jgi:predicted O-linked N-acetylglucosamine transferase (SPINDLY family)
MSIDQDFAAATHHHQAGNLNIAESAYRAILASNPNHVDAWQRLGILLHQTGRTGESIDALKRAAQLRPEAPDVHSNIATVLAAAGHRSEAVESFRRALSLGATFPETHNNIGSLLRDMGRPREAIEAYRQAVALRPDYADAWNNMGMLLRIEGDFDGAEEAFVQAARLRPDSPEVLNNLAGVYQETRRVAQAVHLLRRAAEISNHPKIWDNLLLAMYGLEGVTAAQIRAAHDQWNAAVAVPLARPAGAFPNEKIADRRLRVGLVSQDFREHPVGYLLTPVLEHHDRSHFEIVCYSDVKGPDAVTRRHQQLADRWADTTALTDEQLASLVEHDQIDVLFDLALHTANSRLLAFARRPAPVQLTWAGYPASTGLYTIDYRLTDPHLDPLGTDRESLYSEKLLYLPNCFWCVDPQGQEPPVNDPPATRNGFITFGCLNQFSKISDAALTRWAAVMRSIPNSRLRLLAPHGRARIQLAEFMSKLGVSPNRILFMDRRPRADYLKFYHDIDICLDSSPYTAHTTAIDALWMGVPVVTLAAKTAVSRGALSILSQLDLTNLASFDDDNFVCTAVTLSADRARLSHLRATLRPRLMASPIADVRQFTRDLESAIRQAWRAWCDSANFSLPGIPGECREGV